VRQFLVAIPTFLAAHMKQALLLIIFTLICSIPSSAQTPDKFYGSLIGLQPDTYHMYERVFSATVTKPNFRFVPANRPKSTITTDEIVDARGSGKIVAILVEPPAASPYIAFDFNADLIISADERFPFERDGKFFGAVVRMPIKHPLFSAVPMFVRYFSGFTHPELKSTDRLLSQTVWAHAIGEVNIAGKAVRFQFPFDADAPTIATKEGLFGIDVDGDGSIDNEQFSIETSYAAGAEVVLRYGEIYLSTESIDLLKNQIVVRRRPKSDYLREELAVGKSMPDFSFVDFEGKKRSLSEFRGKYLLIEWWGVWCVDCVRDMPFTVQAYERFRSRGLEILGLNWDDKVEDAAGFLQKSKATWPNARKESIKSLTEVTYRIQEYPATVLLDPEGKVIYLKQKQLQGAALLETLDRLLPKKE
jgi:peroxiredoxin